MAINRYGEAVGVNRATDLNQFYFNDSLQDTTKSWPPKNGFFRSSRRRCFIKKPSWIFLKFTLCWSKTQVNTWISLIETFIQHYDFDIGAIHLVRTQNFPETNTSHHLIRTRTCTFQGVRNVTFLETFAYALMFSNLFKTFLHTTVPRGVARTPQRSKMDSFATIVNSWMPLVIL